MFSSGTAYVVDRGLGLGDERDDGVVDHDLALAPTEVGQSILGRVHIAPEVDVLYTASTRAQELQILNGECVGRRKDANFLLLLNISLKPLEFLNGTKREAQGVLCAVRRRGACLVAMPNKSNELS